MKNSILSLTLILLSSSLFAQVWKSSENKVHFFSEAPLENIEATNTTSIALYNEENKQLAIVIPIKGFKFEKELMEEHFNENYMESEKFKNGKFKGTLDGDIDFSKDGTYETTATGILTIHGVEQKRTIKGTLIVKKGTLQMQSKFQIKLEDHDIEIPKIVFSNIAEVIDVTCDFSFKPQPKKK
ncbi:YceI family protein [Salibacteraceae bacterium]|jgi:hypothetical protein|nr:YceI family protein [Salibacteraceae bacterium]